MLGKETTELVVLPGYGQKKLLTYAESFKELAKAFSDTGQNKTLFGTEKEEDRQACIWQQRLLENREVMAEHFQEMAEIMNQVAEESFKFCTFSEKKKKQIAKACKEYGILLRDIYLLENEEGRLQISVTVRSLKEKVFTVEEISDFLSVLFDVRLLPEKNGIYFLKKNYETILFEEEAGYTVLTGVAKAIKEDEQISGDNYSFLEVDNGRVVMALSDGMGSGEKACRDSEMVIDLLEKCLETGFTKERAVEIINGTLMARAEEENMSTLDICEVNLYSGEAELIKIGSSYTYIKRGREVERIEPSTLPMGIFHKAETECHSVRMSEGDYVIMLSDGVVDGIHADNREAMLQDVISMMNTKNSREMANNILQVAIRQSHGKIRDDMTVLVLGLWENH